MSEMSHCLQPLITRGEHDHSTYCMHYPQLQSGSQTDMKMDLLFPNPQILELHEIQSANVDDDVPGYLYSCRTGQNLSLTQSAFN